MKKESALGGGEFLAPRAVVESGASGGDSFVDIGSVGFGDLGDDVAGGGIDGGEGFAGGGVDPLVVDEKFCCGDFNAGLDDGSGSGHGCLLGVMNWGEEKGIPGAGCTQESDLGDWRNGGKKEKDNAETQRTLRSAENAGRALVCEELEKCCHDPSAASRRRRDSPVG